MYDKLLNSEQTFRITLYYAPRYVIYSPGRPATQNLCTPDVRYRLFATKLSHLQMCDFSADNFKGFEVL